MIKLKLNGEEKNTAAKTVAALIEELGIVAGGIAVEVNLVIVKKADYGTFNLNDGDSVEVVSFIGGG